MAKFIKLSGPRGEFALNVDRIEQIEPSSNYPKEASKIYLIDGGDTCFMANIDYDTLMDRLEKMEK